MFKRGEVVVSGLYANGKSDRFYSERKVLNIKWNEKYPTLSRVDYEVMQGYVSHQLTDNKGSMTIQSFCKWASERLDTAKVVEVNSLVFECTCVKNLKRVIISSSKWLIKSTVIAGWNGRFQNQDVFKK